MDNEIYTMRQYIVFNMNSLELYASIEINPQNNTERKKQNYMSRCLKTCEVFI